MLTITDNAVRQFKVLIEQTGKFPRVEIVAGGCNGFDKKFSMDIQQPDDVVLELSQTVSVLVDPMSFDLLSNSIVDYKTDLTGSYFTIDIPEAASTCGCGSSFSL